MENQAPAGWYADQTAPDQERYWDGRSWADQRRPSRHSDSQSQFEELLRELQTANRLLAGIRDRTGIVAAALVVSLGIVLLSVLAQQ